MTDKDLFQDPDIIAWLEGEDFSRREREHRRPGHGARIIIPADGYETLYNKDRNQWSLRNFGTRDMVIELFDGSTLSVQPGRIAMINPIPQTG